MLNVFIVIVTYNGKRWYDRCFTSLRVSDYPINTIVVDNASSDNTVDYIKNNFPEIFLIESQQNLGFGQGNNLGIKYALDKGADYIFLLNQDVWIETDTVSELVRISNENSQYSILSPINVTAEKENILDGFLNYLFNYRNVDKTLFDDLYFNRLEDVYKINNTIAASWFIKRSLIESIGGFDPLFFHFGEDDNYVQRIDYHGYKIGICPKLKIVHDVVYRVQGDTELRSLDISYERNLMLNWLDINKDLSLISIIINLLKQILLRLIFFKKKMFVRRIKDLILFLKMYNRIVYSRNRNKIIACNWIYQ